MKEIIVNRNEFDLDSFVNAELKFFENTGISPAAIAIVPKGRRIPIFGDEEEDRNFLEELQENEGLFFPFSDVNIGQAIECADGVARQIPEDAEFSFGDVDTVGFYVQLVDDQFIINSAVHGGGACMAPPPGIDSEINCGIFDAPMEKFIGHF